MRTTFLPAIFSLLLLICARPAGAYSVLTHEQIIDLASFAAAAQTRANHDGGKVINLRRKGDAA